jgi:hypothetical protein
LTAPVHPKVRAASLAALAVSLTLAILTWLQSTPDLLPGPPWVQGLAVLILPPLATFLAGYAQPPGPPPPD